jgi:phospholipase/carboxylesterase
MTRQLVILLHGVGSNGADMAALGKAWQASLPETVFDAPNAPSRFGGGFAWFSIDGVTEANRPQRVEAARADFDRVTAAIIDRHGFSDTLDQVALVGFSQGSIMALDAVASGRWPIGRVLGYSGRLASPAPLRPSLSTEVLLIHGSEDPVIAAGETAKAAAVLGALNMRVDSVILPGLGHTISAEGADRGRSFLAGAR